jgi:glycosyltransferase involved in cell wall biosynthesis
MPFKLFDIPWNEDEQYEMLAFPFAEWSWLIQYRVKHGYLRPGLEEMFRWVPYYEDGRYDAAVLHLDLDSVDPPQKALSRRRVYEELDALIKTIPKIVIVHGSRAVTEARAREVRGLIGDNHAVVSNDAVAEQLGVGRVILPGVISDDWCDLPKEPRVVTSRARTTSHGAALTESLRGALGARNIELCVIGDDFVPKTWDEYRDFLGGSLIYFAPPGCSERGAAEAMLSGCCVLAPASAGHADVRAGVNTLECLVPNDPEGTADLIEELIADPERAIGLGRSAKTAAARRYDWTRYSQEWLKHLGAVVGAWAAR